MAQAAERSPQPAIPIRRLFFPYVKQGKHYDAPYAGDAALSAFWGVMSLAFPEGERFFVDSVKRYSDRLSDDLKKQVVGFAGQESMHAKEHKTLNERMLPKEAAKAIAWSYRRVDLLLGLGRRRLPRRIRLGVTCALEHFTSIMAEQLLTIPAHAESIDAELRGLWFWHALEELEHKTVAYDVFEEVGGTYGERVYAMILASVLFVEYVGEATVRVLLAQGKLNPLHLRALARSLFVDPALVRHFVPRYLAYFRRDFHPTDHDTKALEAEWRAKLFADGGLLEEAMAPPKPVSDRPKAA